MSSSNLAERRDHYALHSVLHMKKAEFKEFRTQLIVAQYGTAGELETRPAQLHIFRAEHDLANSIRAPNFSLNLETAQVFLVRASPSSNRKFGTGVSCRSVKISRSFCISTQDGVSYQFRARDDHECQLWINMLKFLIIFPFSSVPAEPGCDISVLDNSLNPLHYQADSAWPVYIAADEVGGKCGIAGMRALTLRGKAPGSTQQGRLQIYNLADEHNPVLSLTHSTIRCTGKMGKWLYVEVGTRGGGGPGLLWMYFGSKEKAVWMKEVFYMFLVKQQVSSRNPYDLFPLATPLNSPLTPPRTPLSPASLPTAYSTGATTHEFTPPPIPPRYSHTYEILDPTPPSKTLQRKPVLYECPNPDHRCYTTLEPDLASSKAESKVRDYHKAECKVPDYHILESTSYSSKKHEYARVNKKK